MAFDPLSQLESLKKWGKLSELYHVTTYQGVRPRADGYEEEVTIKIYDAGPNNQPVGQYFIEVEAESGKTARCNITDGLDAAIATVHWADLDL